MEEAGVALDPTGNPAHELLQQLDPEQQAAQSMGSSKRPQTASQLAEQLMKDEEGGQPVDAMGAAIDGQKMIKLEHKGVVEGGTGSNNQQVRDSQMEQDSNYISQAQIEARNREMGKGEEQKMGIGRDMKSPNFF